MEPVSISEEEFSKLKIIKKIPFKGELTQIKFVPLTQNQFAVVDEQDYKLVSQYKWCAHRGKTGIWYAVTNIRLSKGKQTTLFMHRLIVNAKPGQDVDHENRDGLDNQRSNLRLATHAQNQHNRRKQLGSSKYKGVYWSKREKKWRAHIQYNNKRIHVGYYASEIEAARSYDQKARELFKEYACLNFPSKIAVNE